MTDISKIAYEKYKLDWMLSHGHTLKDLIYELDLIQSELIQNEMEGESIASMFDDWEYGYGFSSEIWACYDEFLNAEFRDKNYMRSLLNDYEYNCYLKEMEN